MSLRINGRFARQPDPIIFDDPRHVGYAMWIGCTNDAGYPIRKISGRHIKVSKLVLEKRLGRPIRKNFCALHRCDVRRCVDERCIYEGTRKKNSDDCARRGRIRNGWTGRLPDSDTEDRRKIRGAKKKVCHT